MTESIAYYLSTGLLIFGFALLIFKSKAGRLQVLTPAVSVAGFFLCGLTLMVTEPERVWLGLYVLLFALLDAYVTRRKFN